MAAAALLETAAAVAGEVTSTLCANHIRPETFIPKRSYLDDGSPRGNTTKEEVVEPRSKRSISSLMKPEEKMAQLDRLDTNDQDSMNLSDHKEFAPAAEISMYAKLTINKVLNPIHLMLMRLGRCSESSLILVVITNSVCNSINDYLLKNSASIKISQEGARVLHDDVACVKAWLQAVQAVQAARGGEGEGEGVRGGPWARFGHVVRLLAAPMPVSGWKEEQIISYHALPDASQWMEMRADRCKASNKSNAFRYNNNKNPSAVEDANGDANGNTKRKTGGFRRKKKNSGSVHPGIDNGGVTSADVEFEIKL